MARFTPKESFEQIARDIVSTGQPQTMTVRALLAYFHQERRSKIVTPWIEQNLGKLGIESSHDIDSVYLDAEIELRKTPTVASRKKDGQPENSEDLPAVSLKDPVPRLQLLPAANRPPVSIARDAAFERAVTLMLLDDFSQLPVMNGERDVLGMISWKSIGTAHAHNKGCKSVRDCMIKEVEILDQDIPLFDAVKTLIAKEVVLVRGQDKRITGLVTTSDISQQFISLSEPFLFLEQIENHIRALLNNKFTKEQLKASTGPETNREIEAVSDLNFGDYIRIIENPDNWSLLGLVIDRGVFVNRLDEVRRIRNEVMHFHPDGISGSDLETLRGTAKFFLTFSRTQT
jgi:CBS domain-containing protein